MSFGGPAAQISLMHRILVAERNWLDEEEFVNSTAYCTLLPGPEAMQLATYAGWRMRGMRGGLIAGLMFIAPGAILMALVAIFYAVLINTTISQAAFVGVQAAVLIIICQAMGRLAQKSLAGPVAWALALGALVLMGMGVPFPLVLAVAFIIGLGFLGGQIAVWPDPPRYHRPQFLIFVGGLALWLTPLLFLDGALWELAAFFAKLAAVSFGGAYVGLTYMVQDLSATNILTQGQIMDGLGLAETTPGPLILVTQFAGHMGAQNAGLPGLAGAAVALWMIFVPSFVLVFATGPYLPYLAGHPLFGGGMQAISAAVIGLIAALALWFARGLLFSADWGLDMAAWLCLALAGVLLLWLRLNLPLTLLICAAGGTLCSLIPL